MVDPASMSDKEFRDYAMARGQEALAPFVGERLPMTADRAAAMVDILQQTYQVLRLETLGYTREEAEAITRSSGSAAI